MLFGNFFVILGENIVVIFTIHLFWVFSLNLYVVSLMYI